MIHAHRRRRRCFAIILISSHSIIIIISASWFSWCSISFIHVTAAAGGCCRRRPFRRLLLLLHVHVAAVADCWIAPFHLAAVAGGHRRSTSTAGHRRSLQRLPFHHAAAEGLPAVVITSPPLGQRRQPFTPTHPRCRRRRSSQSFTPISWSSQFISSPPPSSPIGPADLWIIYHHQPVMAITARGHASGPHHAHPSSG